MRLNVKSIDAWFIASIAIAAIAFWIGPGRLLSYNIDGGNGIPSADSVAYSIWLGWAWILTLIGAAIVKRRKAIYLLLLAPLVLYWPLMWIYVGQACDLFGRCGSFMGLIYNEGPK
jgi:hypothetical protein